MWPCLEAMRLLSILPGQSLVFPSTIEIGQALQFNRRVDLTNEYIQQCWMVCVLAVLQYNITQYEINNVEENRARSLVAIHNMPPRFWIPDHVLEEDEVPPHPLLRPTLRFGEPPMIPLHRCFCLLQYLELTHGSESRRERYLDARVLCSGEEFEVTEHDIPGWMRHSL